MGNTKSTFKELTSINVKGKLPISLNQFSIGDGLFLDKSRNLQFSLPVELGLNLDSLNKIDTLVNNAISNGIMPGCQIVVSRYGEIFYQKSFNSISCIPLRSRFSVIVARRVYKKIGDYILKQKNTENYNKAGKIYVPIFGKIIQTFFSIFDFIKLLFVKQLIYDKHINHNILDKEVNLNERI